MEAPPGIEPGYTDLQSAPSKRAVYLRDEKLATAICDEMLI